MGKAKSKTTGLADALFSRVQQRVLGILFSQSGRSFSGAELIRLAGSGTGAVHREITRLAESGLVTVTRVGNQKQYRANHQSPVFQELHGVIVKTVGLAGPLREALEPFAGGIRAAFIYGSVATGNDTAASDIDLLVIADDLGYQDLYAALQPAEAILHRPVNPTLVTAAQWKRKLSSKNPFAVKVTAQPKIFVIGSEDVIS